MEIQESGSFIVVKYQGETYMRCKTVTHGIVWSYLDTFGNLTPTTPSNHSELEKAYNDSLGQLTVTQTET